MANIKSFLSNYVNRPYNSSDWAFIISVYQKFKKEYSEYINISNHPFGLLPNETDDFRYLWQFHKAIETGDPDISGPQALEILYWGIVALQNSKQSSITKV